MAIVLNKNQNLSIKDRFFNLSFFFIFVLLLISLIGSIALYSAAGGDFSPWCINHVIRLGLGFGIMIFFAMLPPEIYYKLSTPFYIGTLALLIVVEIGGYTGMGAQRWINLGFMKLQPSELMKIAIVLELAKYFTITPLEKIKTIKGIILPSFMALFPFTLIVIQPDLGTSLMVLSCAGILFFLSGVQWWKFASLLGLFGAVAPVLWHYLHTYQKNRILTFLDPTRDPQGTGYHIIQAKIALGSGGGLGKGFLKGTQSHLNFLPEKHTDFIFTMFSEEFGMLGGVIILFLNFIVISYCYWFTSSLHPNNYYGRLVILGLTFNYFLYIFINIAMVIGLLPVVGVPLPLISYGGTVIISVMASFGIILSFYVNRNRELRK